MLINTYRFVYIFDNKTERQMTDTYILYIYISNKQEICKMSTQLCHAKWGTKTVKRGVNRKFYI